MALTEVDVARLNDDVFAATGPNKNRIINGDMRIDQRYAGGAIGAISGAAYTVDRWRIIRVGGTSTLTPIQSTTAPAGFTNSLLITAGSGATPAGTEERVLNQPIEGFNVADLGWGTASAQSVTLSFWVRSSLTGTFGVVFSNSAGNRSYVGSYVINSANTWEYKTVTIPGDTTGTWLTNNGIGLSLIWDLGTGTTYSGSAGSWQSALLEGLTGGTKLSATSGATFYITGVQLEAGDTATPFERRSYGQELALCQRYFEKNFEVDVAPANGPNTTSFATGGGLFGTCALNGGSASGFISFKVQKRAAPSIVAYGNSNGHWLANNSIWSANVFAPQTVNTYGVPVTQQQINAIAAICGFWTANAEL